MLGIDATGVDFVPAVILLAILLALAVLLVMSVLMTLATRFKSGAFWKNTIILLYLRFLARTLRAIGTGISYCAVHLPLYWQAGLIFVGISLPSCLSSRRSAAARWS